MNQEAAARKIQAMFRRKLIFTNNRGVYKLSRSAITAQIVSFKLPTNWRAVFDSTPKGFSEIVGYKKTGPPVVRWVDGRWLGESAGVVKVVAKYRNVTIVLKDAEFDVLGAGNYEQALLAIVKSGWAPKLLLKAPPTYKKIDGMFNVNRSFDMKELAEQLRTLPADMRETVTAYDKALGYGIPAVVLKLKKPKWTYQFFENGTVLFTGIKDPKDIEVPKELFKQFLSPTYGIAPAFVFNVSKRPVLLKPRRKTNATNRLAGRYKLAGTWDRLRPAPEGYYIRPGTDGKPRLYPWIVFETRGGAAYGEFGANIVREQVPIRHMNLKAVAPKVFEAFRKAGKPIPAATAKVFTNAGHPLAEKVSKEPALGNRRAPSWNATKPGFYVRPGLGKQPYWFAVPAGLAAGRKTVIKTYTNAGRNIPRAVRNIFKIGNNVQTAGPAQHHVVKMGLNGLLHINNRQATRLTKAELLAVARNLNIPQATGKMAPANLIGLIQRKTGAVRANRSYNTYVNGMFYTLGNNGRVTRTTREGIQTHRAWATLPAEEQNKIAKALLSKNLHGEYNALPKTNRFNALRAMANVNRTKKAEAATKAKANEAVRAKAAANKAKANAEEALKENAEANVMALELEYALRLAQNLGNLYASGNEQAFLAEYRKLPSGARGKPLKANVERAYKAFIKNLKTQRSGVAAKNAFKSSISVPNWLPDNKVNAYKTLVTNLAFRMPRPKEKAFKVAIREWLNKAAPQSPARAARQVENAVTGQKRIVPAYVPAKRASPVLPSIPRGAKKRASPNRTLNYVYAIPRNSVNMSNALERLGVNTRKNWTWNEIRVALKGKVNAAQMKKLHEQWKKNVMNKVKFGAAGPLKRKVKKPVA